MRTKPSVAAAVCCAAMLLAAPPALAGPDADAEHPPQKAENKAEGAHRNVTDSMEESVGKIGAALKSKAEKIGPTVDHGVAAAKQTVEKAAIAIDRAVKSTGQKISDSLGSKSSDAPEAHSK